MKVIEITQCFKSYQDKVVLSDCSLALRKGEIYGLLGKNGAGKSTLFKLLTGLAMPEMGKIQRFGTWDDKTDNQWLKEIGFFVNQPSFYLHLSAAENIAIHLAYMNYQSGNIKEVLTLVGLDSTNQQPVKGYSTGMKQRLAIARAISHDPQVLILDEPINGLDPSGSRQIRKLLVKLARQQGKTLLISSHLLPEVEQICDRVGILVGGQIVLEEKMEYLKKQHQGELETYLIDVMEGASL